MTLSRQTMNWLVEAYVRIGNLEHCNSLVVEAPDADTALLIMLDKTDMPDWTLPFDGACVIPLMSC